MNIDDKLRAIAARHHKGLQRLAEVRAELVDIDRLLSTYIPNYTRWQAARSRRKALQELAHEWGRRLGRLENEARQLEAEAAGGAKLEW